jgi:hypothetical protein
VVCCENGDKPVSPVECCQIASIVQGLLSSQEGHSFMELVTQIVQWKCKVMDIVSTNGIFDVKF